MWCKLIYAAVQKVLAFAPHSRSNQSDLMQQQKQCKLIYVEGGQAFPNQIKTQSLCFSPSLLFSCVPLHPRSHLPTLPSLWSVLGLAMMA